MQEIAIFPTLVLADHRPEAANETEQWFDIVKDHSTAEGITHENVGYQSVHHDPRLHDLFTYISEVGRQYLDRLGIDRDRVNLIITKAFINIAKNKTVPPHDHCENHFSFCYYPHVNPKFSQELHFFQNDKMNPNEPIWNMIEVLRKEFTVFGSNHFSIVPETGMTVVFPGRLRHATSKVYDRDQEQGQQEQFLTFEDFHNSRICLVGDFMLTAKTTEIYDRIPTPVSNWREF